MRIFAPWLNSWGFFLYVNVFKLYVAVGGDASLHLFVMTRECERDHFVRLWPLISFVK